MSEDLDLENWEPEPAKPDIKSMLSHASASPYRADPGVAKRKALALPAYSRRFECPGCGILKNVDPVFSGDEWHYAAQCSHCGARWVNAYHLLRKCGACDKKVPITSRNPEGRCKCSNEVGRPF
jgi:hypothetical protein